MTLPKIGGLCKQICHSLHQKAVASQQGNGFLIKLCYINAYQLRRRRAAMAAKATKLATV
jgi:hypothetical protein